METAYSEPTLGQMQAPHLLGLQELTRTSRCGQPSSPETFCLFPFTQVPITVASGTLQPSLHHHPLPHPPPVGKSPAAGWPLSTGFVLLHKMNCCGVGVAEAGHTEHFWGSGWLGVPGFAHGDKGEQLAARLPTNLALPPCHSGFPGMDSALPPRRAAAALAVPQTPSVPSSCTFTSSRPLGFVPTSSQCQGQSLAALWVGRVCSGRGGRKTPQKPLALAPQTLLHDTQCWQTPCPAGSGETKIDLFRGNKDIKIKEK